MAVKTGLTVTDLKGRKIGLSKSLDASQNDWWRTTEEQGIELMLQAERHDPQRRSDCGVSVHR